MFDKFGRPSKDAYFMNLAFNVSLRSIDPHTKHGAVVVDNDYGILTCGYNSWVRNADDDEVELERSKKSLIHAEMNAILQAAKSGISLKDSRFYITGSPCIECFQSIIQVGAKRIIYGPKQWSKSNDPEYLEKFHKLYRNSNGLVVELFNENLDLLKLANINVQNIESTNPKDYHI